MNLYTLGYEGFTLEAFINRLQAAGVTHIVDVRELPLSRKKGFSKKALSAALNDAGITYTHIKMLGCPKPLRDYLKQGGSWRTYATAFSQHLAQQTQALDDLINIACNEPVSLLCFEADFKRCHRSLVASAAVDNCQSLKIVHLTAKIMKAAPPLQQVA
ncbi:DUF488 domain-containing protein [Candidatus Venteria ishoeyi]|uniref:DUF488 domain-containing protein n=1 Tax=Candidatus Venteria ishoeyi TaxID=1899563 RepID=A0A1H6FK05_9GAMM|nr:DUF488 domain-containing protein [Candidatus Venteria ishoeyi]SEH09365.1 Uncharacterised protein [Candidatus Venteria ishoeyi]